MITTFFSNVIVEFKGSKGWEIGFEETPETYSRRYVSRWGANVGNVQVRQELADAAMKYLSDCILDGYEARITFVPSNPREGEGE